LTFRRALTTLTTRERALTIRGLLFMWRFRKHHYDRRSLLALAM
jgi:hypothetical protein